MRTPKDQDNELPMKGKNRVLRKGFSDAEPVRRGSVLKNPKLSATTDSLWSRFSGRVFDLMKGDSEPGHADSTLLAILIFLILFGLVVLASAGSVKSYNDFDDPYYLIKHQVLNGLLIGGVAFYIMSHIDYHYWRKYAFPIAVFTLILLFAVFIPGLGEARLGAKRWIAIGGFDFQPSEIVKMTFLIYLAAWLEKHGKRIHDPAYGLMSFVVMMLSLVLLIAVGQKDLGTMIVIGVIAVVVYFVGGAPVKDLLMIGGGSIVGFLFLVLIPAFRYRLDRILVFFNHDSVDKLGTGLHVHQALIAIGSGGFFGLGYGHSLQKYNYLPEVHTDSIFAIISEELGFFFAFGIVVLFTLFTVRALKIAKNAPDEFGKLLAVGIATWIGFQAVVNIGAMLSLLPLTGIPLPFISYGSSAMITLLAAVGVLVNISRQTK